MRNFFLTSEVVLAVLLCGFGSSNALALFGPSTTDYLVRNAALSYLEDLSATQMKVEDDIKKSNAKLTAMTQTEIEQWNKEVSAAESALKEVVAAEQEALELLKAQKELSKGSTQKLIEQRKASLEQLINPKGIKGQAIKMGIEYFNQWAWGTTPEQQLVLDKQKREALEKEIAFYQGELNKLAKAPELSDVKLTESMKLKRQEANDKVAKAKVALDNLQKKAEVVHVKDQITRLKSYQSQFEASAKCMIKLADCKGVKTWATFSPANTASCKQDNLAKAQKKATNPKCAALTTSSTWSEIDNCIPEYRSEILKKAGSEGSRQDFDKCRRL